MAINIGFKSIVLNAYAVLAGEKPGYAALNAHLDYVMDKGIGITGYKAALEAYFATTSTATLATALLTNLGLTTSFTQAQAEAFLNANAGNRVGAMLSLGDQLYSYAGTDAALKTAQAIYAGKIAVSNVYSSNPLNLYGEAINVSTGQTVALTTGFDSLIGSGLDDIFLARTIQSTNTFQDRDTIDGGAGNDTIYADMVNTGNAYTPILKNIETVVIRAQSAGSDSNGVATQDGNNMPTTRAVQIDAQRSLAVDAANKVLADTGVARWESSNSRSDVVIEDVRIGNTEKTKNVTIAMVETDPGNVDFGVYFDQFSLRNTGTSNSTITIQLMDTGAASGYNGADTSKPLLNNPYDTFKFLLNGVQVSINLNPAGSTTVASSADTYAQLLAAFQTALTGTGVTASLGANFTINDPLLNKAVTGQTIVLSGGAATISTNAQSGWYNTLQTPVPADANIYNKFGNTSVDVTELVTSMIVLDDVGRGSTGGDLVVGGLSIGESSTSRGVERFEITVNDNSKLQTINSTNNALREVTIQSGVTSKTVADAYTTTVTNEGNLTVNGGLAANNDTDLPGVNNFASSAAGGNAANAVGTQAIVAHSGTGSAGFTDVRLIDASQFKGKLAFTAAITSDSIAKYITLVDTAASPAADVAGTGNINFDTRGANFAYSGGNDNDTMAVTIDAGVAASRSTIVSGQSDFTFNLSGGAGDDTITLTVNSTTLNGGAQAWYNNQKLNANITIDSGDGNDTIKTPGAGDVIIGAGAGNDLVYTDNTGALNATATANGAATAAALAYANADAAEIASANAVRATKDSTDAVITTDIVARLETLANGITGLAALPGAVVAVATDAAVEALTTPAANIDLAGASLGYRAITAAQKTQIDAVVDAAAAAGTAATAAHVTAIMAIVQPILDAARAADAAAKAADSGANLVGGMTYLTATGQALVNATAASNAANLVVTELAAIKAAGVVGATDASILAALETAVLHASLTGTAGTAVGGNENLLQAAIIAGGANTVIQAEVDAFNAILAPLQATAAANAATATTNLNTATTNNNNAVLAVVNAGGFAAGYATTTANNLTADKANQVALTTAVTNAQTKVTDLTALKTALTAGMTDADYLVVLNAAQAKGTITGPGVGTEQAGFITLSAAAAGVVGVAMTAGEKTNIDLYIDNLLIPANKALVLAQNTAAYGTAVLALDQTAATIGAAATASGGQSLTVAAPKAVYVFNTTDQKATYDLAKQDDRNLADLKSDVNTNNNFTKSTVKVNYKGIEASGVVEGTAFKTSDLEINQKIKELINLDPVLKTLIVATDGPANSLVVTSLIDGVHALANLAISVTIPAAGVVTDVAGAAAAYGLAAGTTEAALLTYMATQKAAFDTKGDYATQFAESGAAGGNTNLVGAASISSSDNTITPGTGNDVIVLGTTVGTDAMTSSNERVIYSGSFGADTIVNFAATGLGIDTLDFSALNGRGSAFNSFVTDKSIVVAAPTAVGATILTAAQIAALFTDSATAINHVYVAVDATNIGSIWQVADAAGTGGVVATLVGSIDLADTAWSTLTAANFV